MRRRELLALPAVAGFPLWGAAQGNLQEAVAASTASLEAHLPTAHPRLLIRGGEVASLTAFLKQDARVGGIAPAMKWLGQDSTTLAPPAEPVATLGRSGEETAAARAAWRAASGAANVTQLLALRHLLYGHEDERRSGIRWLIALVSWKMTTEADYWRNPEAFVQTFNGMVFAFDWLYQGMTPEQRDLVQRGLGTRLDTLFGVMRKRLTLDAPVPPADGLSHPMRYLSVLGHAGMALWGHHAAAREQLAWVLTYYRHRFPIWGGNDGGWSEGIDYQTSGLTQHLRLLEDLFVLGVKEPLQRPFWRNTGYFLARFLPPYDSSSFSDLPTPAVPTASRRLLLDKLARLNGDGQLLTLALRYGTAFPGSIDYYQYGAIDSIFHVWRTSLQPRLQAAPVDDLPRSWLFGDVGWVSLQSGWDQRGETIMMGFKSSPVGSVSHGFADQNAFVINAYRHAMAVSTGMRDWFGSPHYERWTRAARSKNTILVNGQGPGVHDASATGNITRFISGRAVDFVTGDASPAYRSIARRFLRHILFVDRRYFLLLDEIRSAAPATHQWLLHARAPIEIDTRSASIDVRFSDAGLRACLLEPSPELIALRVSDQFDPPPEAPVRSIPAQWHLVAESRVAATDRRFLAVLEPWRIAASPQRPQRMAATVGHAARIGTDVVLISDEDAGTASTDGFHLVGRAGYQTSSSSVLVDGRAFKSPTADLQIDSNATVELVQNDGQWILDIQPHPRISLTLAVPSLPRQVSLPAAASWSMAASNRQLRCDLPGSAQPEQVRIQW